MTELPVTAIKVEARRRQDLGDIGELADSIRRLGMLHPVVVTPDHLLVAGQRRLEAARGLGWDRVPVRIVSGLGDAVSLLQAERDENVCRKDFTLLEAAAVGEALEALYKLAAKERQALAGPADGKGKKTTGSGNLPEPVKGRTRDQVGAAVGMSGKTYEKVKVVAKAAEKEPDLYGTIAEEMERTGKVEPAYQAVKTIKAKVPAPCSLPMPQAGSREKLKKLKDREKMELRISKLMEQAQRLKDESDIRTFAFMLVRRRNSKAKQAYVAKFRDLIGTLARVADAIDTR